MTNNQTALDSAINANLEAYTKAYKNYFYFRVEDREIAEQFLSTFRAIEATLKRIFPSDWTYIEIKLESAINKIK